MALPPSSLASRIRQHAANITKTPSPTSTTEQTAKQVGVGTTGKAGTSAPSGLSTIGETVAKTDALDRRANIQKTVQAAGESMSLNEKKAALKAQQIEAERANQIANQKAMADELFYKTIGMLDRSDKELEARDDWKTLEKTAALINFQNTEYVDNMRREGEINKLEKDREHRKDLREIKQGAAMRRLIENIHTDNLAQHDLREARKETLIEWMNYETKAAEAAARDSMTAAAIGGVAQVGAPLAAEYLPDLFADDAAGTGEAGILDQTAAQPVGTTSRFGDELFPPTGPRKP